jgi:hypothetical protein
VIAAGCLAGLEERVVVEPQIARLQVALAGMICGSATVYTTRSI